MALSTVPAGGLSSDSVTTAKIVDDAVTGAKIENSPTIAANLTVSGTTDLTGKVTASGDVEGFGVDDRILLNATDGSATDAGDFLVLNSTDGSANDGENVLFETLTNDGSAVLNSPIASFVSDEIKTDKLTGNTAATNITVSDGSTTMKLQDGLAKVGIYYDLTNNTNQQSWNVTSITDHGTGNMQIFYIESMTGNAVSVYSAQNGTHGDGEIFGSTGNSHYYRIRNTGGTLLDSTQTYSMVHGDLA